MVRDWRRFGNRVLSAWEPAWRFRCSYGFGGGVRIVFIVWEILCCCCGLSLAQTDPAGTVTSSANMAGMPLAIPQSGSNGIGPVGIPLGSTGFPIRGESPVMLSLSRTLTAGNLPAGPSGIPLGATELSNSGSAQVPQIGSAANSSNAMGSRIAASASAGTLPARLFDGRGGNLSNSNSPGSGACTSSGFRASQRSALTQGRSGIGLGAIELSNNGLAGFIAVPTAPGQ
jgi:hypothetical protein